MVGREPLLWKRWLKVLFETTGSMLAMRVISPYSGVFPLVLSLTASNLACHCSDVRFLASMVSPSPPTAGSGGTAAAAAILQAGAGEEKGGRGVAISICNIMTLNARMREGS